MADEATVNEQFHELRVPLNTRTIGLQLMSDAVATEEGRQLLCSMQDTAALLADNFDQVLALHRLREGDMPHEIRAFDVRQWLEQVVGEMHPCFAAVHTTCVVMPVDSAVPVMVQCDAEQSRIMLRSALSAMSNYLPDGAQLLVRLSAQQPQPRQLTRRNADKEVQQTSVVGDFPSWIAAVKDAILVNVIQVFFSNLLPLPANTQDSRSDAEDSSSQPLSLFITLASSHGWKLSPQDMRLMFKRLQNPEQQQQVLRTAEQQRRDGSGLGLQLAKEILQQLKPHRGIIELLSAEQGGSRAQEVCIHLPVELPELTAEQPQDIQTEEPFDRAELGMVIPSPLSNNTSRASTPRKDQANQPSDAPVTALVGHHQDAQDNDVLLTPQLLADAASPDAATAESARSLLVLVVDGKLIV